ncbi:ferredoxin-dependent glutamate synthase 1, chloroplastic/mitochondrial-like [Aristolochia californica]|uniref:ferredoxin-dependent glutamate synthase 1, chloroplastic/mitochondrial-like n=1 Tax=Aristolochia californica TaxID=171875 RepID=UPI0035D78D7E
MTAVPSWLPQPQLLYPSTSSRTTNSVFASNHTLFFDDLMGFCSISKRRRHRNTLARRARELPKRWSGVKSVLELDTIHRTSKESDITSGLEERKVVNFKDIIAERGACGVGFIANLDNEASHGIVKDSLTALGCMEHRGGCGADNDSGDGSGVMTSIPWDLYNNWAIKQGLASLDKVHTGVGMLFLPTDENYIKESKTGDPFINLCIALSG